jgi:hypothetical protein
MPSGELPELNVGTTMAWRNGEFVEVNLVAAGTSALQLSAAGGVVLQMQTLYPSGQPMDVAANGMLQVFHNHQFGLQVQALRQIQWQQFGCSQSQ